MGPLLDSFILHIPDFPLLSPFPSFLGSLFRIYLLKCAPEVNLEDFSSFLSTLHPSDDYIQYQGYKQYFYVMIMQFICSDG